MVDANIEVTQEEYLNPDEIYRTQMDNWEMLWDDSFSFYENVHNIISQSVFIPKRKMMLPIVATYLCASSKWSRVLPVLMCWGQKGSGKSQVSVLGCKLHGQDVTFSPRDTFSYIRNKLDAMRWEDKDHKLEKDGAILCWDNLKIETFIRDEGVYQLLLFGYNRSTDRTSIATADGGCREFRVFCPKVISTVDDIHTHPDFEELHRRLLVIPHKPYSLFTDSEKAEYSGDILERLDPEIIYWKGIEQKFNEFWCDRTNCEEYVNLRTKISRNARVLTAMSASQWTISVDLITTAVVMGAFNSAKEAIYHFDCYWNFAEKHIFSMSTATLQHLQRFIAEETTTTEELNKKLFASGQDVIPVIINAQKLKNRISFHHLRGELDIIPSPKEIVGLMNSLGWRLQKDGWVKRM